MALKDLFKIKKGKEEEEEEKEKGKKEEKKKKAKAPVEKKPHKKAYFHVIKSPYITEKSIKLAGNDQYTFKVASGANKIEIRKAVESLYNVEVLDVRVIKVNPKKRSTGRTEGWRPGFKKAVVKIKAGQRIEDFYH